VRSEGDENSVYMPLVLSSAELPTRRHDVGKQKVPKVVAVKENEKPYLGTAFVRREDDDETDSS
jgi:hypothetical protein